MFAVAVTMEVKPGRMEAFLPLMFENATASLREEAGCRQFDVCRDADRPDTVFLYETYDSPEAFQVHLASPHFKAFDDATGHMLADKQVSTWRDVRQ